MSRVTRSRGVGGIFEALVGAKQAEADGKIIAEACLKGGMDKVGQEELRAVICAVLRVANRGVLPSEVEEIISDQIASKLKGGDIAPKEIIWRLYKDIVNQVRTHIPGFPIPTQNQVLSLVSDPGFMSEVKGKIQANEEVGQQVTNLDDKMRKTRLDMHEAPKAQPSPVSPRSKLIPDPFESFRAKHKAK